MLLLKRKSFEVSSDSPRVTEAEAASVAQAADIVAAAEADAERIRAEAREAYESERKHGYEVGLEEGRAQVLTQKFNLVAESVRYMESVETSMSELVLKVLRKFLGEMDAEEIVRRLVAKAMQAIVRNQRQITVKVAPAMVQPVKSHMQEILKDFPSVAFVEVTEGAQLKGDACVVETAAGVVEASVTGQLAAIDKAFHRNFTAEAPEK